MAPPVAVIDIGSNSIKLLVARRGSDCTLDVLLSKTIDARISAGISRAEPELSAESMRLGIETIQTLMSDAAGYSPGDTVLVATSAVRDARNGREFGHRVRQATGLGIRVLSGTEEASLIGRGLTCDPALSNLQDFYVFDLGGGSLECLAFRGRKLEQTGSLQLGCVRLTERFVADPARPFGRTARYRIMQHVHDELVRGPLKFTLPEGAAAVGTGGTMATVRAMIAARNGTSFDETDAFIPLAQFRLLLTHLSRLTLDERRQVPGLPPTRADIFPAALATLIVLGDLAGIPGFRHSLHNLRFGLADEVLSAM